MPNSLTREVGFRVGPLVLETLIKHYFDRIKKAQQDKSVTQLRQDELLYDEAFNIVKAFLNAASFHTVEDVQGFANTRTPSPPWVHVVRVVVPMSSCDEAASLLIKALGGEDFARRIIGGVKWWQVRGITGVDAQWITAKKDWQEAKRRHKMSDKSKSSEKAGNSSSSMGTSAASADSGAYEEDMDEMRCILYSHGGGYYFGSVDQERYSIQRHARKINGRVFAVNYRLAPQYPFPCALQDVLAAYIYLIRPPPGALHRPVNPSHIIIAGDSAGGGISLALLQVIRDSGLPPPAGGVLISPWCDLTHSFPSVHTNTATDVIPDWGLSLQKPSVLWPPPSEEITNRVHASLRSRIRQTFRPEGHSHDEVAATTIMLEHEAQPSSKMPVDVGTTAPPPPPDALANQTISLVAQSGELLTIEQQVHLYTQNSLLAHPLISSALSYLGGLPPLLIIASDKEVLRDEIIYAAHKAANPEKYPLKDEIRAMYPPLASIENQYKATKVHLQVYDDTAHVLPVLFSFTTPAKFCFRAIATFCKHVTGMVTYQQSQQSPKNSSCNLPSLTPMPSARGRDFPKSKTLEATPRSRADTLNIGASKNTSNASKPSSSVSYRSKSLSTHSLKRSVSTHISRAASGIRRRSASFARGDRRPQQPIPEVVPPLPNGGPIRVHSDTSSDVGGPRFRMTSTSPPPVIGERTAGDPIVYSETPDYPSWSIGMIRERVSTHGVIRPLEPEAELDSLQIPPEIIGVLSELAVRRYIDGRAKFDKKFAGAIKTIEKHRRQNLDRAKKDTTRNISALQNFLNQPEGTDKTNHGIEQGLLPSSGSWSWAWALDGQERPPPSSIVSRRDTEEARRLAKIADHSDQQDDHSMSGNNFWSTVVDFLTVAPEKDKQTLYHDKLDPPVTAPAPDGRRSALHRFIARRFPEDEKKGEV